MSEPERSSVVIEPIGDANRQEVVDFLVRNMEPHRDVDFWKRAVRPPWPRVGPNEGLALRSRDDGLVGAYLAYFSEREIDGRSYKFCNLGTWCVLPEYRFHSLRLLKAMLGQEGLTFTDFTPSERVVSINKRLGFEPLPGTELTAYLGFPQFAGLSAEVLEGPAAEARLDDEEQATRFRDHDGVPGVEQILICGREGNCHVIYRVQKRRGIRLAMVVYASDAELLRRYRGRFGWHLLRRHGLLAVLAERRLARRLSWLSKRLDAPSPKMALSKDLGHEQIDYLYSELVGLPSA
jgi:hypothetical protein